jgi:tetratricopeptide (TPR) repeat protein
MAEDFAKKALRLSDDHLDSHFVQINVYFQQKRWQELEHHVEAFFRILERIRSTPESIADNTLHSVGECWRVRIAMGALHLERGAAERARAEFRKASSESTIPHECLKMIADCYKSRAFWEEAAFYYRQSFIKNENFNEAILGLALAKKSMGENEEAIQCYKKALALQPDSVEPLVNLGHIYHDQGYQDMAHECYNKAIQVEPRLVNVSLRLAHYSVKRGQIEECIHHCENILGCLGLTHDKRLESLSDLANLFLIIGHELDRAGQEQMFKETMEIVLSLDPNMLQKWNYQD